MTTETDTTSEVARVLRAHEWRTESGGVRCRCQALLPTVTEYHDHQAAMLAEAGLLRDEKATTDLGQSIIALLDQVGQLQAKMARLTEKRAAECIGNAFSTWATDPTVRDAARRVVAMVQAEPRDPQIAAPVPAGEAQATSGGPGASGGLGRRLRALGTDQTRGLRKVLRRMADEADELEGEQGWKYDPAHDHTWVSSRTLGDRGGFEIQSCTGCPMTREEPS